ncbi:predicted protein [Arabidopsis lyrata subsp. lyrata]|uniref:Predicted protein n=1 Tax=Arabidopsis lyrata subsp. lyrata TaxID=81972 RepID=D7M3S4_ARALL|nr:predicted protein [Arabidopsis lyrata subsp. lyrata]
MGFPLSSFPTVLLASLGRRLPPGSPLESPLPPEPPDPPDLSSSQISFWGFTSFPLTVRNFEPPLTDFPPLFNSPPLAQFVVMKSSRLTIRTMTVALYLVSSGGTPFAFISGFRFYQVYVLLFSPFGGISCNVGKKIFTGIFRWLTISSLRGMDWCVSNVSEDPLFNSYVDAAWTALFAETLAVELALLDAQSAGFHKLKVFSVCKVLISLLISGTSTVAPRSLLHDIRELSVSFTLICFYFVSRLETVIAESLAISALSDVIPFSSVWR